MKSSQIQCLPVFPPAEEFSPFASCCRSKNDKLANIYIHSSTISKNKLTFSSIEPFRQLDLIVRPSQEKWNVLILQVSYFLIS